MICCSICNILTDKEVCIYCSSTMRDRSQICVVENNYDVQVIENSDGYDGLYHVLHGSLAPVRGIGPEKLMLKNLLPRLSAKNNEGFEVRKIIIAVYPTNDSTSTVNYIERLLKPLGISIERMELEMLSIFETETIQ